MLSFYRSACRRPMTDTPLCAVKALKVHAQVPPTGRAGRDQAVLGTQRFLRRFSAPLLVAFLGLFAVACSSSPASPEFVRSESGGNVNLTIATSVVKHPSTTITVAIDDALVVSQLLTDLIQEPKHYRLKILPGHHEITARANTGRTKEVFPIFIHEDVEWLTLTYLCECEGGEHPAKTAHFSLDQPQTPTEKVPLQQ